MSERSLDSNLKTNAQSGVFTYAVLVKLSFPGGPVRVHNSIGTISHGGFDYLGVGAFGSIEAISETIDIVDQPVNLVLSSITPEIIDAIQNTNIYGRDAEIFLVALNEDGEKIGEATSWIVGTMEKASLSIGEENAVTIKIQTRAAKLRQRNNKRWTLEHHQRDYPGDRFFEFLPYVINADVQWAGERVRSGFTNTDDNIGGSGGSTGTGKGFGGGGIRR